MPARLLLTAASAALALVLTACGGASTSGDPNPPAAVSSATPVPTSAGTPPATAAPQASTQPAATEGAYVSLAEYRADQARYDEGTVVLFFAASWCPTCQRAERNLRAAPLPAGLTVVRADYDAERDLRRTYGVTVQHTFVQVDASGRALARFSGQDTARAILAQTV